MSGSICAFLFLTNKSKGGSRIIKRGVENNIGLYISLFTYKLSLFDFAKLFVITEEMYVVRYNQVRYKQVSLYL
jgi:hypothetical protein